MDATFTPFEESVFEFQVNDCPELNNVPLVQQALYFLQRLSEKRGLKATAKGNLPTPFVRELHQHFFQREEYSFLPHNEHASRQVSTLRHLLAESEIIGLERKRFTLTSKGKALLEQRDLATLYWLLFETFAFRLNWAFYDRYPDLPEIQQNAIRGLHILELAGQQWTTGEELGKTFIHLLPDFQQGSDLDENEWFEETELGCFVLRFLERFCVPLGLVERKKSKHHWSNLFSKYRITPLFSKCVGRNTMNCG